MPFLSPLAYFGNRSKTLDDIFELIINNSKKRRYHFFYDLFSGSGSFGLAAIELNIAEKYVINDAHPALKQFWLAVQANPEIVIENYQHLVKRFEAKKDLPQRTKQYEMTQAVFNLSQQAEGEEMTASASAIQAATFAFIVNHSLDGYLLMNQQQELVCKMRQKMELPEIDNQFAKAVRDVHALFKRNEGRIIFESKHFLSFQNAISDRDLVVADPPYPDMADAVEAPEAHVYLRTEPKSELQLKLQAIIDKFNRHQISYLMFYGVVGLRNDFPITNKNGHFLRLSGEPSLPFGEYLENLYLSSDLSCSVFPPRIIRYDYLSNKLQDKNQTESVKIVKQIIKECSEWNKPFPVLFEERVKASPHKTALVWQSKGKSYACTFDELNQKINQLAAELIAKGVTKGHLVAILVEDMQEFIKSMLAVLKIGAAYMPISVLENESVLHETLQHAQPQWCLAPVKYQTLCSDLKRVVTSIQDTISSDDLKLEQHPTENPHTTQLISPDDIAYVMNTSGSTGKPKGATNLHRGIPYVIKAHVDFLQLSQYDRIAQMSKVGFDGSLMEILLLVTGGTLYLISSELRDDDQALQRFFQQHAISVSILVPSKLRALSAQNKPSDYPSLRAMIVTGEKFDESLVKPWLHVSKEKMRIIVDGYGPTEATIATTLERYTGDGLTIGRPIIGTKVYLVKYVEGETVPSVVPPEMIISQSSLQEGELYIAGANLGIGYWRDEERTKQSFVEVIDPELGVKVRAYRTGDLCKWVHEEPGKLAIIGRIDNQIKLRGQRLDPEQIEFHLKSYQENNTSIIEQAYVVGAEENGHTHLVAYLKIAQEKLLALVDYPQFLTDVRRHLQKRLPHFMVPNAIEVLDKVPLINGKVNRKFLKNKRPIPFLRSIHPDLPANEKEVELAKLWGKVLNMNWKDIKRYDDFFCLGGSSLLVSPLLHDIRQSPDIFLNAANLKPDDVYHCSHLKSLARRAVSSPIKKLIKGEKPCPTLIVVHSLLGDGWSEYGALCDALKSLKCTIYALQAPAIATAHSYDKQLEELASEYIASLEVEQRINPTTPIIFIGWSSGGIIASEMVRQLSASQVNGQSYSTNLVLIDAQKPDVLIPYATALAQLENLLKNILGNESRRTPFQQRQYEFALWLFRAEYDYFLKNATMDHLPANTLMLLAKDTSERNAFGYGHVKQSQRVESDHFTITQSVDSLTMIAKFCQAVAEEFQKSKKKHLALAKKSNPDVSRVMQSILFGSPQWEGDKEDKQLYDDEPDVLIEVKKGDAEGFGNLYNFLINRVCSLILEERLPEIHVFDELLGSLLQLEQKTRSSLKNWLNVNQSSDQREIVFQPLLKEVALRHIEINYDSIYSTIYEKLLWETYEQYLGKSAFDAHYLSEGVYNKFNSEQKISRENLIEWWRSSGKAVYFDSQRKQIRSIAKYDYWTCKIEIEVLCAFLKIKLQTNSVSSVQPEPDDQPVVPTRHMFLRQQPFLSLETGEAYQPNQVVFEILNRQELIATLNKLKCNKQISDNRWDLYWKNETDALQLASLDSYVRDVNHPPLIGKFVIEGDCLLLNLLSMKRACLLVPFCFNIISSSHARLVKVYYHNVLFGLSDPLPSQWSALKKMLAEDERLIRNNRYRKVNEKMEQTENSEEAFHLLSAYTKEEGKIPLSSVESYAFSDLTDESVDVEKVFLGFYIYMRGRELVAIRKWMGQSDCTIGQVAEETVKQVYSQNDPPYLENDVSQRPGPGDLMSQIERIKNLELRVQAQPNDHQAWKSLGDLYFHQKNMEKAQECYSTALAYDEENTAIHQQLGYIFEITNMLELSAELIKKSIMLQSRFSNNYLLGIIFLKRNVCDQALNYFLTALSHGNDDSELALGDSGVNFLKEYMSEECLKNEDFKHDKRFLSFYFLVICFDRLNDFIFRDFYILKLNEFLKTNRVDEIYKNLFVFLCNIVNFENNQINEDVLNSMSTQYSNSANIDNFYVKQLAELVGRFPSHFRYQVLVTISQLLNDETSAIEYQGYMLSLEGSEEPLTLNRSVRIEMPTTHNRAVIALLAKSMPGALSLQPNSSSMAVVAFNSRSNHQEHDIQRLVHALLPIERHSSIFPTLYPLLNNKHFKEIIANDFIEAVKKAVQIKEVSIMPISLTEVIGKQEQYWIGLSITPNSGKPLKPTIRIIDPLGNGFDENHMVNGQSLFALEKHKERSPLLWEAVIRIMGMLNGITLDQKPLDPIVIVEALKQINSVEYGGLLTVVNLVAQVQGEECKVISPKEIGDLQLNFQNVLENELQFSQPVTALLMK